MHLWKEGLKQHEHNSFIQKLRDAENTFFFCCSTSNITQLCFEMHCTAAARDQWASLINLVFLSMWKNTDSPSFDFLLVVSALCGTNSWICQHCVGSLYFDRLQTIWETSPASPRAGSSSEGEFLTPLQKCWMGFLPLDHKEGKCLALLFL